MNENKKDLQNLNEKKSKKQWIKPMIQELTTASTQFTPGTGTDGITSTSSIS